MSESYSWAGNWPMVVLLSSKTTALCGITWEGMQALNRTERKNTVRSRRDARERYQRYQNQIAEQGSREVEFTVGGEKLKRVRESKYLGRIVSDENDDDTLAIESNLKKARMKWAMFKKVLMREHAS